MTYKFYTRMIIILLTVIPSLVCENRIITTLKYSQNPVQLTIVHGKVAKEGQIPYLVSFKEKIKLSKTRHLWRNLCGGSIISPWKVLTAAHCFESSNFYYQRHPEKLRVVAGSVTGDLTGLHLNSSSNSSCGFDSNGIRTSTVSIPSGSTTGNNETNEIEQWRKIQNVTLHRNFHFPANDIALVFVNSNFNFTKYVDYVLPAVTMIDYAGSCRSAGFGQMGKEAGYRVSNRLLWAFINVLPRRQCNRWWEMDMDTYICSNTAYSTDVAGGDSGGPLVCFGTLDPHEQYDRDLLVGIVSGKNYDKTTLFTRVAAYKDWLARDRSFRCQTSKLVFNMCLFIKWIIVRL